ncbi:MAG: hypothetical protein JW900_07220, partial [Anaerolineae bacterium]|nr:hypothetical protein [Anaerolineae bacterium]
QAGELPAVPRLVLFLDDLDGRPDLLYSHARQILEHGAAAGIHVIASITDALLVEIAGLVPLFPIAIQGQAPPGAHIARTNDGQESRLYGAGDFLVVTRRGDVARMAAAYIDKARLLPLLAAAPSTRPDLRLLCRQGGRP